MDKKQQKQIINESKKQKDDKILTQLEKIFKSSDVKIKKDGDYYKVIYRNKILLGFDEISLLKMNCFKLICIVNKTIVLRELKDLEIFSKSFSPLNF